MHNTGQLHPVGQRPRKPEINIRKEKQRKRRGKRDTGRRHAEASEQRLRARELAKEDMAAARITSTGWISARGPVAQRAAESGRNPWILNRCSASVPELTILG
ncbi:unnamed protein product [Prorocentrum cordatum]|uniref:Uncharacterized protein n=1 Tax=Prorocentrum cordatum TaxID=2364126 RepID=A0ABN9T1S0_9DINO|nr:unnamed protein product [Polarella glacialis]